MSVGRNEAVMRGTIGIKQDAVLEDSSRPEAFRLSDPPAQLSQPVTVVELPSASQAAVLGQEAVPAENGLQRSSPPPPETQPVQVVEREVSASAQIVAEAGQQQADQSLSLKENDYAREIGGAPDPERETAPPGPRVTLDNREIYRIVREVAVADSGDDLYTAVSADREYETRGRSSRQFGLGFGLVLFTQESGHLGSVLQLMHQRDPSTFAQAFGPQSDQLLTTTNAATPSDRLRPVGGEPLWSPSWVERFHRAGAVPAFQAAQNEEAIEGLFRPMLNVATGLGFITDRGLAMVFDCVVRRGLGGGLRWLVQVAGPLRTAAQRQHGLDVLGFEDLMQFQNAVGWTPQNGVFGPETHAALVGALRRQGEATLPTSDELMCSLLRSAAGAAKQRLVRLRDSTNLSDVVYAFN